LTNRRNQWNPFPCTFQSWHSPFPSLQRSLSPATISNWKGG
jgi:hypothetical protein